MKQARQACEAWRADAQHYKMIAEKLEMERNRAIFERDQVLYPLFDLEYECSGSPAIGSLENAYC